MRDLLIQREEKGIVSFFVFVGYSLSLSFNDKVSAETQKVILGEIRETSFSRWKDSSKSGIPMDRNTLNHLILSSCEQGGDIELARKLFRDGIVSSPSSSPLLDKECCTQLIL